MNPTKTKKTKSTKKTAKKTAQTKKNAFEKAVISWEAPEYIQHEKGWKWFLAAGMAIILFSVWSVLAGNWTLVIALVVLASVYYWQHFSKPEHVKVIISRAGIKVKNKEFPFQNIESFWIIYRPPHVKTLNIRSNSKFLPDVTIQLGNQDPGELREYLASQIRELEGKEETFIESLIRIFKL